MIIQHNMASMFANRNLKTNAKARDRAAERLSSGFRINRAADDAAGLTITEKMRWQIRGLSQASENIQDGISLIQVGDGALEEVHSILQRMNELSVQAANDTNTDLDRQAIQEEIDMLRGGINQISTDTTFNTLRIFKPTNVPEIKGKPNDICVYHEDVLGADGRYREAGIIYNGKRYAYDEDIPVKYDAKGNIKEGVYGVNVIAESGNRVVINLIFDGSGRTPCGRKYAFTFEDDGIYIDDIRHDYSTVKLVDGTAFNPDDIAAGTYSFSHAGATFSFEAADGIDLDSLADEIEQADGLEAYYLQSSDVQTDRPAITYISSIVNMDVTSANKQYAPCSTTTNSINTGLNTYAGAYKMHADETGVYMYLEGQYNGEKTGDVKFTFRTWDEIGLTDDKWENGINQSNTVTGGETRPTVYRYTDDQYTGITINFTVDSEATKAEVINSINDWRISTRTNNSASVSAKVTKTGSSYNAITADALSAALGYYGTQYAQGRSMDTGDPIIWANDKVVAYDAANGGTLTLVTQDANGKQYTYTASNIDTTVSNYADTDKNSFISSCQTAMRSRMNSTNGNPSNFTHSNTYSHYIRLTCAEGYSFDLNWNNSFSTTLSKSDFTYTSETRYKYYNPPSQPYTYWTSASMGSGKKNEITSIANNLATYTKNSLHGNTTVTMKTDSSDIRTTLGVSAPLATYNRRYNSSVVSGDRKLLIQAGAMEGQTIEIRLKAMNAAILKVGNLDVTSHDGASSAIKSVGDAIESISDMRSYFGAMQNRLEHAKLVNDNGAENAQAAESRIRDADMAEEMIEQTKHNILIQAGQSILSQANQNPQQVVSLLQ